MNFDFNIQELDLTKETTDGARKIETGWYKIALKEFGEEKEEKKGEGFGTFFTFEIVDGDNQGLTFRKYFCTQAKISSAIWRQRNFENIICRIAQCCGIGRLTTVEQLINLPFYSYITAQECEYESKDTDRDGNFIVKKTVAVDFGKGLLVENILSCAEYETQQEPIAINLDNPF